LPLQPPSILPWTPFLLCPSSTGEFADANQDLLQSLPPPLVAAQYYTSEDLYLFDEFQTSRTEHGERRSPPCNNLYDVFINIR
jgi:ubiquinol oxidase